MAGKRDVSEISVKSVKQQSANLTLWRVRKEGHTYVEIRQDGKRLVFFCVLCLSPCYCEKILFEHLSGRNHREKYKSAKLTLLGPNPWPFSDGVFFFHNPSESERNLSLGSSNNSKLLITDGSNVDVNGDHMSSLEMNCEGSSSGNGALVVPGVLRGDEMLSLDVKLIGFGKIGARIYENGLGREEIKRIWCAWLGEKSSGEEDLDVLIPQHDFGIVTFSYNYNLGRKPLLRDLAQISASNTCLEIDDVNGQSKRIKIMSVHEDTSQSLSEQCNSSVEDDQISVEVVSADKLQNSKSTIKRYRKYMRQQKHLAAERMCDLCNIRLLPGKDVACLMNMKTGRLACSSRNTTGAFHLFHTSCLLHWILLCEVEVRTNRIADELVPRQPAKKTRGKRKAKKADANKKATLKKISSVFCPECQGTGIIVEDQLEKPSFFLSEMFTYKMKSKNGQKEWIKSPEIVPNCCSVGFHFPRQTEGLVEQEQVADLKLLPFYRADV